MTVAQEQHHQEEMTVVQVDSPSAPPAGTRSLSLQRRNCCKSLMCLKERLQPALRPFLITLVFLLAAAGFVIFNTGAARTVTVYDDMKRAAVLSVGILHLMSAYNGCRWAAFGTGLAALLVFPVVMIASAYASRIFIAARGRGERDSLKRRARLARAALVVAAFLCAVATVAAVISLAANTKAADKVSEVQSRIVSGQGLLNEGSSALTALQSSVNSTSSPVAGLLDTVLDALSGASSSSSSSSSGDASNPLASLESSSSLPSLFKLIAPMTVGSLVSAIDPSPQGLLSLVAFLSNKISSPSTAGLTCAAECLNQIDACICNVNQLPILSAQQQSALDHATLSLVGSCMMAAGFTLLLIVAATQTARFGFQQGLVFGSEYDRQVACKHAIMARSNARLVGISSPAADIKKAHESSGVPIQAQATET